MIDPMSGDPRYSGNDFEDDADEFCPLCGDYLDWTDCWQCHGEGEFDLYESNPLEYEPGEVEVCGECNGEGGYLECPNAENHDKYLKGKGTDK